MNTIVSIFRSASTVGHAALACAASLTIMSVALSAAHAKEIKLGGFHSMGRLRPCGTPAASATAGCASKTQHHAGAGRPSQIRARTDAAGGRSPG